MSEIQPQCVRCPRQCDYNILRLTPTSLLRSSVLLNRYPPRFSGARLRYHPDHSNILSSGRGFTVDRGVYCTFLPKKDYSVTDLCFQRLILVVYDLSLSLSLSLSKGWLIRQQVRRRSGLRYYSTGGSKILAYLWRLAHCYNNFASVGPHLTPHLTHAHDPRWPSRASRQLISCHFSRQNQTGGAKLGPLRHLSRAR